MKMVMQQFGMNQSNANSVMASLFKMLKQLLGDNFGQFTDAIPGAKDWLDQPEVAATQRKQESSGGLLSMIIEMIFGKKAVALGDWLKLAKRAGLDFKSAQQLIVTVLKYAQQFLGKDGMEKMLGGAPQLTKLLDMADMK